MLIKLYIEIQFLDQVNLWSELPSHYQGDKESQKTKYGY